MYASKLEVGFTVICVVPVPVTFELVTSIVSKVLLSEVFLIVIFPVSTSTLSSKFKTIFALSDTLVALSAGVDDDNVGLLVSPVVKLKAVVELIPA